jgi:hypothetical protein
MSDGGTWLTYEQAAARFGLKPEAMRKRSKRLGWASRLANDGKVHIRVPEEADIAARQARHPGGHPAGRSGGQSTSDKALEAAIAALRERAEAAERRAEEAEARVRTVEAEREVAWVQAARAEGEAKAQRDRIAEAQTLRLEAEAQILKARGERDRLALQVEEWTSGGPIARAVRAFLLRRGRPGG